MVNSSSVCCCCCCRRCHCCYCYYFPFYSLKDLETFIEVTSKGLAEDVVEGDYDKLVEVMGHLIAVKDRQPNTDNMFEPLKQTIELLATYDQEMSETVHQQLEVSCNFSLFSR